MAFTIENETSADTASCELDVGGADAFFSQTCVGVSARDHDRLAAADKNLLAASETIRVPQDYSRIQTAINAAKDGDVVLVAPGVYREQLLIRGKQITLASRFLESGDKKDVAATVLDGFSRRGSRADAVIRVTADAGPSTRIVGFTIRNGDDGISCAAKIEITQNRFVNNKDALDYEGGGGVCRANTFEDNRDDGIDLDGSCAAVIEQNVIRNNDDDGIEIRLHPHGGRMLNIVIRSNRIVGNGEDGIQIIDYPDVSNRVIRIERNLIANTRMAAIGCMSNGNTRENYEAANIPERIEVINNTLVDNFYGITGGDSVLAINNLLARTKRIALKRVDGRSILAFNLLWNNGTDTSGSNVEETSTIRSDPRLDSDHKPVPDSPCIDAGTAELSRDGAVLFRFAADAFSGAAPDVGAFEAAP